MLYLIDGTVHVPFINLRENFLCVTHGDSSTEIVLKFALFVNDLQKCYLRVLSTVSLNL
jgi:hypothetical protein